MYYLWEFVCGFPEILVSCAYFEILLMVYEMIDPLLGAPSQGHIHHPICDAPTRGSIDNSSTHGIHVVIEFSMPQNECLSTRDSNMSKNGHFGPIHPYLPKYNQLYYNSFKS